jgi:hypothetical protein
MRERAVELGVVPRVFLRSAADPHPWSMRSSPARCFGVAVLYDRASVVATDAQFTADVDDETMPYRPGRGRYLITLVATILVVFIGAGTASAHGGDESDEASVLVRQAIAILVNDSGNLAAAAEKVDDAEAAADQEGVDLVLLEEAAAALAAGDGHQARSLLERSIGARSHLDGGDPAPIGQVAQPLVGADTGVAIATDPLDVGRDLTTGDWAALGGLLAIGAIGVALSRRFRPVASAAIGEN